MTITITDKARHMLHRQGVGGERFLRILVKAGGCAGMTYDAEIDVNRGLDEQVVQRDGDIAIVSNPASSGYLDGLEIDYSDDLISAGYRFKSSSNESSCGCGASFSLAGFPLADNRGGGCGL